MASKEPGSGSANVPKIDKIFPYTMPAESVTVKYEQEPSTRTDDTSKKEIKSIRKSRQKSFLSDIKAENLEGHKNFDNIEDILTFINGKKIENGKELEKDINKEEKIDNSLGAIKKTFSFKDTYSKMKYRKCEKNEKEKPVTSLQTEKFFQGSFSKNSDTMGHHTNTTEVKDEQFVLESIVSNNKADLETNIGFLPIETTSAKVKKFYDRMERKDLLESEGSKKKKTFLEISSNIIEMCDSVTVIVEKQTKLKKEVSQLYKKQIELNNKQIELIKIDSMKMNNITLDKDSKAIEDKLATENSIKDGEKLLSLEQKYKQVSNVNKNELATLEKKIVDLEEEKEAQNEVLKNALKKLEELEAKCESPKNDCLSMEYKPTKPLIEDVEHETSKESTYTSRESTYTSRESTYELTFHKTSLATFKTSGKEDLSGTLNNCGVVLASTNWSILEWGIDEPHPDCHKKLDEENQRRRCSKEICKKCNHDMKGCGLDLRNCDRCELVIKAIAYHEEYTRIEEIVEQGGWGKQIKRRAEVLAKDSMRSFQNVLIPFLVSFIKGETKYFLEYQENMPVEERGAAKLKDVWERLQYVKFSLQRVRIDQDYLDVLQLQADNLKEVNQEYDDVLDEVRSYVSSRKQLAELWDSNMTPNYSATFQEMEKDLDSWTKCGEDSETIANEVFTMIDTAENSSTSGLKVEVVDLKCVEAFLCSALSFTRSSQIAVIQKIPLKMMQKMHWAKELISKIHCVKCRKVILVPGENVVHLEKCSVCKAVRYCNTTCQQLHWEDHKDKCAQLKKMEKKRKREASRSGEKLIRKKEKFWEQVLKPLLCRPGVTLETLENSL